MTDGEKDFLFGSFRSVSGEGDFSGQGMNSSSIIIKSPFSLLIFFFIKL